MAFCVAGAPSAEVRSSAVRKALESLLMKPVVASETPWARAFVFSSTTVIRSPPG
jgi:hypothetical protein